MGSVCAPELWTPCLSPHHSATQFCVYLSLSYHCELPWAVGSGLPLQSSCQCLPFWQICSLNQGSVLLIEPCVFSSELQGMSYPCLDAALTLRLRPEPTKKQSPTLRARTHLVPRSQPDLAFLPLLGSSAGPVPAATGQYSCEL